MKLKDLPGIDVFRNLASAINTHVLSPELRQLLARFATYVGSDPYKAPALLSVIAHVELAQGVWYPKGGVYTLAEALERIAIEKGVNIYTNRTVVEILVLDKSVKGVRLEDGSIIESNLVISNVDTATAYSKLLPSKTPYIREQGKMVTSPLSFSAFIILLGVNGINENLEHHNIFFSKDYQEEFRQLAYGLPPDDPTIYVAITSKTDIHHAPMNCENWFVMVNVAPLKEGDDWNKHKEKYKQQILNTFKEYGYDLTNRVVTERIITPVDLEFNSGSYRGALYGINFNKWNAPFLRPKPQDKHIRGLYHVGGTTHPGGGVPMVMLSAKTVAKLVENNIKLKG